MESRQLERTVAREEEAIERLCRQGRIKQMADRALRLGDLCRHSGHTARAIDIWSEAVSRAAYADYEWVDEPINPRYYRMESLVAAEECMALGRRIDEAYRSLGHREEARYEVKAKHCYVNMWLDKYAGGLP